MSIPLVSVIMPAYNVAKYIQESIESVIQQTYRNWELIIIDDGSTDKTLPLVIENYSNHKQIKILTHQNNINLGVSRTRDLGVEVSKGDYIAYLDADDYFHPNKLESQLEVFNKNPSVVLVHSRALFKKEDNIEDSFKNEFIFKPEDFLYNFLDINFLENNHICNSTVMIRKHVLEKLDNSFAQLYQYEDWVNWTLIAQKGLFYYLNKPTITYRYHAESSTSSLVKNILLTKYAKIEFLLILMSRINDKKTQKDISKNLFNQLEDLFKTYSNNISSSEIPIKLESISLTQATKRAFIKLINKLRKV